MGRVISLDNALREFIKLLDKELYFDAHEVLEEAWHTLRKSNHSLKNLVKGIINASIAFEHIKRDRLQSRVRAKRVMVSFDRHIGLYKDDIEHYELFKSAIKKIKDIREVKKI